MRWQCKKPVYLGDWHPWFAWRPVRIENTIVWLETIERKLDYSILDVWSSYRFPLK